MMHQMKLRNGGSKSKSQSASRKSVKKKDDSSLNQGPPNVTMEQYAPAIKVRPGLLFVQVLSLKILERRLGNLRLEMTIK